MDDQNKWDGFEAGDPGENLNIEDAKERVKSVFTDDFVKRLFKKNAKRSENILNNNGKFEDFIQSAEQKLKKFPAAGEILSNIPTLIDMLRCYLNGDYRNKVSVVTIISIITALAYWILPIDVIPDVIPVAGMLDDGALIAFCIGQIREDLQSFRIWRAAKEEMQA